MKNNPIDTVALFPILDELLIELLEQCTTEDWHKQTIAKQWKVKDVAAHLLDGNLRAISIYRDNFFEPPVENISTYGDLVNYLNVLNATWVNAVKRLSPQVLLSLLSSSGEIYCAQIAKLEPAAPAIFPVSWAGETESANWFHIAREYTEKYIHQMQIRDALGKKELLFTRALFNPFINTFMHALPHTFRNTHAEDKTVVEVIVTSEAGGKWYLVRFDGSWVLDTQSLFEPSATVSLPPDVAWKLFSKGMSKETALEMTAISGDIKLGSVVLDMVAVMA